jgi:hypothetical protein
LLQPWENPSLIGFEWGYYYKLKNELSKKGQVVIPNKSLKRRNKIVFFLKIILIKTIIFDLMSALMRHSLKPFSGILRKIWIQNVFQGHWH